MPLEEPEEESKIELNLHMSILNLNEDLISITRPKGKHVRKRILLINPPVEEPAIIRKKPPYLILGEEQYIRCHVYNLPIGLLRIANSLLRKGNEVCFLDCMASLPRIFLNSKERKTACGHGTYDISDSHYIRYYHLGLTYPEIERALKGLGHIDEVFVGCTFTYHNEPAHHVVGMAKRIFPGARVRFGGIYPTLVPEEAKKSMADEVFVGEFLSSIDEPLNYHILGYNPGYTLIKGTKGCPHRCSYCAVHKLEGKTFCFRNPDSVFAEICRTYCSNGTDDVVMWDSNVLVRYTEYLGGIFRLVRKHNLPLHFYAPEGLDYRLITKRIAQDLKMADFRSISLALENMDNYFSESTLNRITDRRQFGVAVKLLMDAGFAGHEIQAFIIIGLPNQTLQNVLENICFVWSLGCNVVVFPFTPIPGTQIYERYRNELAGKKLRELHPFLYPFVGDRGLVEMLIELSGLNILLDRFQKDHFEDVIQSPRLRKMLGAIA